MKIPFILSFALFIPILSISQEINRFGHFIDKKELSSDFGAVRKIELKSMPNEVLPDASSVYYSSDKIIVISFVEENLPTMLSIFDIRGTLIYKNVFRQIINPRLTENKKFFSFYCNKNLYILNLSTVSIDSCRSSLFYDVDDYGQPVTYYENTIRYEGKIYPLAETPSKILKIKNMPVILTRNNMFYVRDQELTKSLSFRDAFFDAQVKGDTLMFVLKKRTDQYFRFTLYKTADLQNFSESQCTELPLSQRFKNPVLHQEALKSTQKSDFHESIRGPLDYSNDSVLYAIGNSYAELQDYGSGSYLHPGVDFLANPNEDVYAIKTGVIKAVLTTGGELYWRIAVANNDTDDETTGYLYAHLNELSIPYVTGDSVYAGEIIGTIVPWPVDGFDHIHFGRIQGSGEIWDGKWWTVNNPLPDIVNLVDTIKPVIDYAHTSLFAFRNLIGEYIAPDSIYDNADIIVKAYDQCNSSYKLEVYQIQYSLAPVSDPGQSLIHVPAFTFDMPLDEYIDGDYTSMLVPTIYSFDETCFSRADYTFRDYYHIITNSKGGDTITRQDRNLSFDSRKYPNGEYYLKVTAIDASMNTVADSIIIHIQNKITSGDENNPENTSISLFPNPVKNYMIMRLTGNEEADLIIFNSQGQVVKKKNRISDREVRIDTGDWQNGIYLYRLVNKEGVIKQGKFLKF